MHKERAEARPAKGGGGGWKTTKWLNYMYQMHYMYLYPWEYFCLLDGVQPLSTRETGEGGPSPIMALCKENANRCLWGGAYV